MGAVVMVGVVAGAVISDAAKKYTGSKAMAGASAAGKSLGAKLKS